MDNQQETNLLETNSVKATPYYIFSPVQFKEYGGETYTGDGFSYRFQHSSRFFIKSIYIPFGPICEDKKGFDNFIAHICSLKHVKIRLDLPILFDEKIISETTKALLDARFKKVPYEIQDEETILLYPGSYALEKKDRYYVRNCRKTVDIKIVDKVSEKELEEIYQIYVESAKRHHYNPKSIEVFKKLNENTLSAIAVNKENGAIEGFLLGYIYQAMQTGETKNILGIMFAGMTDYGKKVNIGYGLYFDLIENAFATKKADIIDMIGASRTKNRDYTNFKSKFSKEFTALPGSFIKTSL